MDKQRLAQLSREVKSALATRIFGLEPVIEEVMITVLCQGHALLTGAPGVAKTTLVRNLASSLGCGYKRIQFTPDLTPFDIVGGETIQFDAAHPDRRKIGFVAGPIFAPFVLADEINRASPRTQAALLEAMQERQVTVGGETRALPKPFYVFATQNPIESDGTFPLPEAQLDRFLFNIEVPYPSFEAEKQVAVMSGAAADLDAFEGAQNLFSARPEIERINVPTSLLDGIVRIVRNTRPSESQLKLVSEYLDFGASPRASQSLVIAAKAKAFLDGALEVTPAHVMRVAPAVLRHRCVVNFKAMTEKRGINEIVEAVLNETVL